MVPAPIDPARPEWLLEREFIGYGMNPPNPQWPNNSKIAVSIICNYFLGAESTMANGDEGGEPLHCEIPVRVSLKSRRTDMTESQYEFGGREGMTRLLKCFTKYNVPVTWNISTQALEKDAHWLKPMVDGGHELSCASKRFIDYMHVSPEEEEKHIKEAVDTLQSLTGDKTLPQGWFVDRCSNVTPRLYAREHAARGLPLLYSSDAASDDLPYWVPSPLKDEGKEDTGLLVVPHTHDTGDFKFNVAGAGWASPRDFFEHLKDTFDILYSEGEDGEPKMMTVIVHPHIIGRGGRFAYFEEFIKYITSKPDVWIARRDDIAKHWAKTFPYDPKTAFGQTPKTECW
ncbi:hypothetical protein MNV49_002252 [Pseudohyphozyma bogoriensis]|nr:hypothetical protein MNV49_002252 [Pseudohyphozyma bogoriensis]